MAGDRRATSGLVFALVMLGVVIGAWSWRAQIMLMPGLALQPESWETVRELFPMPADTIEPRQLAPDAFDAILQAHPFSSQRDRARRAADAPGQSGAQQPVGPPRQAWVYKGRVRLGSRERAILEETASGKTHFLEVGQEVAGYKVLDIAESRVLLSELKTDETIAVSLASSAAP